MQQQGRAVVVETEGFRTRGVNTFILHGRQMCQQRISINGVGIFVVASEQEQRFAVQASRRVLTAKLDDIVAFALTLAGVQSGEQRCR